MPLWRVAALLRERDAPERRGRDVRGAVGPRAVSAATSHRRDRAVGCPRAGIGRGGTGTGIDATHVARPAAAGCHQRAGGRRRGHVGGHRRPGQLYNTRAWLLYEAGRRADLDLTALTADANYVSLSQVRDATKHWWLRAARHARGPTPFDNYALTTISALRSANGMMSLRRPTWVARAAM